ncbi:MFS transporter [Yinghuangia seranimata]|uniref:MFS transporter n=1 Tax=Yinghuangia seranimata TaxID=408067 RepID=UPI00248B204F|nr:MFS transporter [Yinghuangia seranimata]MDI2126266.1 MFS transporter [Yinghuangia seranimata]
MYLSSSRSQDTATGVRRDRARAAGGVVTANVVALGLVSLVTDISSEMVTAVMPVYLVAGLGLSILQFGFLDGLYQGVTVFLRLAGGHIADRFAARKKVAAVGYGVSAVSKLGFPLIGASVPGIGTLLAVDRAGKGLRTAPRDALISLSSTPESQGKAFGVHRALDTVGAFTGPFIAFLILSAVATAYDAVFVVSFCVGAVGLLMLLLFVRDRPSPASERKAASTRAGLRLLRDAPFRRLCGCALLLGAATVSDAFVFLVLQRRLDLAGHWFPLLPLGTAGVYLLLALPMGLVADRVGRRTVFLLGHVALGGVYALLAGPVGGLALLAGVFVLHGTFYAMTDGVLMAAAGAGLPAPLRTSGLAVLQTGQAAGKFVSSVAFGWAWTRWGPERAVMWSGAALAVAFAVSAAVMGGARARARWGR